ncbi:MAG: SHOCT domain-containing protein [Desulfovibrio sp.]
MRERTICWIRRGIRNSGLPAASGALAAYGRQCRQARASTGNTVGSRDSLGILKSRLANGEITLDEFNTLKQVLH